MDLVASEQSLGDHNLWHLVLECSVERAEPLEHSGKANKLGIIIYRFVLISRWLAGWAGQAGELYFKNIHTILSFFSYF